MTGTHDQDSLFYVIAVDNIFLGETDSVKQKQGVGRWYSCYLDSAGYFVHFQRENGRLGRLG